MVSVLPPEIVSAIELQVNAKIKKFHFVGGGCINNAGRLETSKGSYFLKWNDRRKFPGMFAAEAKGLALLKDSKSLKVPEVVMVFEAGQSQFLVLEYIESSNKNDNYWSAFGSGLAGLHQQTGGSFGLDHDNYIGSLRQHNAEVMSWTEFFIDRRLTLQLKLAVQLGKVNAQVIKMFERFFVQLPNLLPTEPPSLVHGDLWSGNIMVSSEGWPCLIDPAVYFGHREMDLAMTELFGGFDVRYYNSYNEIYPLQPGYKERVDIYNLYPLLVHANLFDGSYAAQALAIVKRFV